MRKKTLAVSIAALTALSAAKVSADTTLTLQSAFPFQLGIIKSTIERFGEHMEVVTDGELTFRIYDAGEFSPPFEILENVGSGALDVGWSAASYWEGQMPGSALFQSIPFGPDVPEYFAWLYGGGGLELWRELYEPYNVVPVPCGSMAAEATGWFSDPITSLDDLDGLSMRISGLGGQVLSELGVSVMDIPVGEAYQSLDTGRIGAVAVSSPGIDVDLGFEQIADYYYVTSWHQRGSLNELIFNMDVWNSLSDAEQQSIENACSELSIWTWAQDMNAQSEHLEFFRSEGVNIETLPSEVVDGLREASEVVLEEKSQQHDSYARILASYHEFREKYHEYQTLTSFD